MWVHFTLPTALGSERRSHFTAEETEARRNWKGYSHDSNPGLQPLPTVSTLNVTSPPCLPIEQNKPAAQSLYFHLGLQRKSTSRAPGPKLSSREFINK